MGTLQWHSLLVESTDQIVQCRIGCWPFRLHVRVQCQPTNLKEDLWRNRFVCRCSGSSVGCQMESTQRNPNKRRKTDRQKPRQMEKTYRWNQSNNHVESSRVEKSLNEPGMPDYENCQCESNESHSKTGAATRLRQTTCVPKPYKLTANKAPVVGSLRVRQP